MFVMLFHALALVASAQTDAQSKLTIEPCKPAEVYAFSKSECLIKLFNSGDKPIRISDWQKDAEEDSVSSSVEIIPPRSERFLPILFDAGNAVGMTYHTYRFKSDEPGFEARTAGIRAFALNAFEQHKPEMDFGLVEPDGRNASKLIEFSTHEAVQWKITKILGAPSWLNAKVTPDGHGIEGVVKPKTAWGLQTGFVKLAVDVPQQSQVWVWVKADVHGDIVPSGNPYDVGLLKFGNHNQFKIQLEDRSGKSFKVSDLRLRDIAGDVKTTACVPARSGCELLDLTISDAQPAGSIRGYVDMNFRDREQQLSVLVTGLIIDPQKKIIDLNSPEARAKMNSAPTSSAGSNVADLTHEIQMAVKAPDEVPPGTGPLLKWKVANGGGIHGFQVFRSDVESGPFFLVNRETVRSRTISDESQEYQYRDNSADAGKTYWYYIGIVYTDGHSQQLSGPQKVVAK